jgi:predicted amidohydrolase
VKYKVGFCQFNPEFLAKAKNLEKIVRLTAKANADLLVFPELATSGYTFSSISQVLSIAETAHEGITATTMKKVAAEYNCSLVLGFAERQNDAIYNSSMLINPQGNSYIYRKTHLFLNEKIFFTPGNTGFQVFPAKMGVNVGMMICFDWFFPESARALMLKGAQIIAHPANLVMPWCQKAMLTRSIENRIFTITANRTGSEFLQNNSNIFTGFSQITDTKGNILAQADGEEETVKIAVIDTDLADDKFITPQNNLITDRRNEYYHS